MPQHDALAFEFGDLANCEGVDAAYPFPELQPENCDNHFLPGFEHTSLSTSTFGNLESVSHTNVDVNASSDYGYDQHGLSNFPFDDYLVPLPDLETTLGGVEVELTSTPSSFAQQSFQSKPSPSSSLSPFSPWSGSSDIQSRGGLAHPAGSSVDRPIAKLKITPALSFRCPKCPRTFTSESRYQSHISAPCAFTCSYQGCYKQFSEARSVQRHVDADHLGIKFTCTSCGKIFTRKDKCVSHQKSCRSATMERAEPARKRKRVA